MGWNGAIRASAGTLGILLAATAVAQAGSIPTPKVPVPSVKVNVPHIHVPRVHVVTPRVHVPTVRPHVHVATPRVHVPAATPKSSTPTVTTTAPKASAPATVAAPQSATYLFTTNASTGIVQITKNGAPIPGMTPQVAANLYANVLAGNVVVLASGSVISPKTGQVLAPNLTSPLSGAPTLISGNYAREIVNPATGRSELVSLSGPPASTITQTVTAPAPTIATQSGSTAQSAPLQPSSGAVAPNTNSNAAGSSPANIDIQRLLTNPTIAVSGNYGRTVNGSIVDLRTGAVVATGGVTTTAAAQNVASGAATGQLVSPSPGSASQPTQTSAPVTTYSTASVPKASPQGTYVRIDTVNGPAFFQKTPSGSLMAVSDQKTLAGLRAGTIPSQSQAAIGGDASRFANPSQPSTPAASQPVQTAAPIDYTLHPGESIAQYNARIAAANPNLPAPGTTSSTGVTNTAQPIAPPPTTAPTQTSNSTGSSSAKTNVPTVTSSTPVTPSQTASQIAAVPSTIPPAGVVQSSSTVSLPAQNTNLFNAMLFNPTTNKILSDPTLRDPKVQLETIAAAGVTAFAIGAVITAPLGGIGGPPAGATAMTVTGLTLGLYDALAAANDVYQGRILEGTLNAIGGIATTATGNAIRLSGTGQIVKIASPYLNQFFGSQ